MAPVASSAPSPPRRYLCLVLPYLPTDRFIRQQIGRTWRSEGLREGIPLAVVAKIKSALRLVALDETAERLGLSVGQALADARAMIPSLETIDEDGVADTALLATIADWAER